jgi:GNAT superfamily N-acetyltransferase
MCWVPRGSIMAIVHAAEFRVLGPTAIEDYHAHLMRLDRASCFPGDDRGIDAHCLDLIASGAILIGAYVKGIMRAGAEIVPDRTARRADAAITVEDDFQERGFERELTAKIIDQARRYHLNDVRVNDQSTCKRYKIPVLELHTYAANG